MIAADYEFVPMGAADLPLIRRWLETPHVSEWWHDPAEQFELVLEGATAARGVIIRATDALNNITSARGEAPAAPARR